MTPADVLWLFFLLSARQPWAKQQYLEASRRRLIAKIERQRKSRVILLVHRQETMSFVGFPVLRVDKAAQVRDSVRVEYLPEHRRFEGIQQSRP